MSLTPYRQVLALPGVARLLLFAVLARVPQTASGVILTLHVVVTMRRGYGAAGLVAGVATVGMAIGGPWRGRAVDRIGLRRSVLPSLVVAPLAWGLSAFADYGQLLVLACAGGVLGLPIFTVTRQSLAVLVPGGQRRSAFSLDGIGTELSFIVGPTFGVLVATQLSTRTALLAVSVLTLVVGAGLLILNPPTRSADPDGDGLDPEGRAHLQGRPLPDGEPVAPAPAGDHPVRSAWFTPALLAVLAVGVGATVVLAGTDVAIVAYLREHGSVSLTGMIFAAWGIGSMIGGLLYGSKQRELSPFAMLLALALLTIPVGLAPGPAVLVATILPAAALCAPVIAATIEGVSRLVPEQVRGEAMGWHGSALQTGSALGAPLAGVVMDRSGAWAGFAAVGLAGAVIAIAGLLVERNGQSTRASTHPITPGHPSTNSSVPLGRV